MKEMERKIQKASHINIQRSTSTTKKRDNLHKLEPPGLASPPVNSYHDARGETEMLKHLQMFNTLNDQNLVQFKQSGRQNGVGHTRALTALDGLDSSIIPISSQESRLISNN